MSLAHIIAQLVERGEEDLAEELVTTGAPTLYDKTQQDDYKRASKFDKDAVAVIDDAITALTKLAVQAKKDGVAPKQINDTIHMYWKSWSKSTFIR